MTTQLKDRVYEDRYLRMEMMGHHVYARGREVELTPLEWKLLQYLVDRGGRVCIKERIEREIWGICQPGLPKWHISNLRKKLRHACGKEPPITTIRGWGYRWESGGNHQWT